MLPDFCGEVRANRLSRWTHWLATGFSVGYAPVAPGTAGSLVGLGLVLLLQNRSAPLYSVVLVILFSLGLYAAGEEERVSGEKDCRRIVVDEIAGMMITGFLLPPGPGYLIAAFVLFRGLDVLKPFPADWMERNLPGGWAIMLDDAVAGIYANLILQGAGALFRSG